EIVQDIAAKQGRNRHECGSLPAITWNEHADRDVKREVVKSEDSLRDGGLHSAPHTGRRCAREGPRIEPHRDDITGVRAPWSLRRYRQGRARPSRRSPRGWSL